MKTETDFRKYLTKLLEDRGAHVSNIESHLMSAGIPDLHYFGNGVDVWLELKIVNGRDEITMRPPQKKWHRSRRDAGGRSWVMVLDVRVQRFMFLPGYLASTLSARRKDWDLYAYHFGSDHMGHVLNQIEENTRNEQAEQREYWTRRNRGLAEAEQGGPGSALRASGEDLVGHHWLHDKP